MNTRRYLTLAGILIFGASSLWAQEKEEKKNLIINGGFESANTAKLKKLGQLPLAAGWTTANDEKVDLFSKMATYPAVGAPKNDMGVSNPKEGDNYVGLVTHLVASRDSREYITAPLDGFLEKGKKYCLSYSISLGDAAKYATNNLGFHFSKKAVYEDKDIIIKSDVIVPLNNKAQNNMDTWEDICVSFNAVGYEKFVTIGNFSSSTRTVTEKMTKPKAFSGEQQQIGYYFLDNISLVQIDRDSECTCEEKDEIEGPRIIFSKSAALKENASIKDVVSSATSYFYSNEDDLAEATRRDLDALAKVLEANASVKLMISGHMDSFEEEKGKQYDVFKDLSKTRAEKVKQYLEKKGVSSSRMQVQSFRASEPATQMKTPLSLAKNRRVEFSIR